MISSVGYSILKSEVKMENNVFEFCLIDVRFNWLNQIIK